MINNSTLAGTLYQPIKWEQDKDRARFSIRYWEKTEKGFKSFFITCYAYREVGKAIQKYAETGQMLVVSGKLWISVFPGRADGKPVHFTFIDVKTFAAPKSSKIEYVPAGKDNGEEKDSAGE
jgi:hypothetical protein